MIINEESTAVAPIQITSYYSNSAVPQGQTVNIIARGTQASPSSILTNDIMGGFRARGYGGSGFSLARVGINGYAAENWTSAAQGTYIGFMTTPIGSTTISEKLRITGDGKVGIGTTNPEGKLSVNIDAAGDGFRVIGNTTGYLSPQFSLYNTTTQKAALGLALRSTHYSSFALENDIVLRSLGANSGGSIIISSQNLTGNIYLSTGSSSNNDTPKLTVLNGGNVGIGTSNPYRRLDLGSGYGSSWIDPASKKFSIFSDATNFWGMGVSAGLLEFHAESTNTEAPGMVLNSAGNVGIGTSDPGAYKLLVAGDIGATSFVYTSDLNLKKNIKTLSSDTLNKILQLRGVSFNWKKDNEAGVGLIAQEVEKVFPELVSNSNGVKGVQYGNLVAPLIEAVKAQQQAIEAQKSTIKEQQANIQAINARLRALEIKK